LDVIEKAIRNALEKGDSDDRAYREKVYRSAFAALDRALAGNPGIAPDVAAKRRSDLQAKIAEIETEFIPAVPPIVARTAPAEPAPAAPPAAAEPAAPAAPAEPAGPAPSVEPESAAAPQATAPAVELGGGREERQAPSAAPPVPSVDAPQRPVAAGRFSGKVERFEPQLTQAPPAAAQRGQRVEPLLAPGPPPAEPRAARVEPRLAGSPPPQPAPAAERPVPESFFPDVSDFEGESRRPDQAELAETEVSAAGGPNVSTDRRRPLAGVFIGVTLLALAGIGVWWGISTGLIKLPGAPDNSIIEEVPAEDDDYTPQPGAEEAPQKPGEADAERAWVQIFSPADPSTLSAPSDAKADIMNEDTGNFVRIRSGASGSAIAFDVSKGVLEQISGKHATFDIVARSEEGKEAQFSVDCNFGELGDCGRKRFPATYEKRDFLFELQMPAKSPGSEGTIAITSDVDNTGKAVDIYEIKVSVSE
jgi:hypothetical protein